MSTSLLLDQTVWDLCLDASGNIAVAGPPYSTGQDVACALRTNKGEAWYDTAAGVPLWTQILGRTPPLSLIKSAFVAAARSVAEVAAATCYISSIQNRRVSGQVLCTTTAGLTFPVGFP